MNKNRKMVIVLLFAFVVCFSLAGCTLQDRIEDIPVARNNAI